MGFSYFWETGLHHPTCEEMSDYIPQVYSQVWDRVPKSADEALWLDKERQYKGDEGY